MFNKEELETIVKRHPDSVMSIKLLENFDHFCELFKCHDYKWINNHDSYLIDGSSYNYNSSYLKKQEELYRYASNSKYALEIGVYVGHSLFLMLLANPELEITAIDSDDTYARPVINYLNNVFNNRITFIHGDALDALEALQNLGDKYSNKFDLVHIDSENNNDSIMKQFNGCIPYVKSDSIFIFNNYDNIRRTVDYLIEIDILKHIITPYSLNRNCVTRLNVLENYHDINHIFYINLDHRKDRKEEILTELNSMNLGIEIERFEAIYGKDLGVTLSHLNVIKIAKERCYKNILIFEDDFQFIVNEVVLKYNIKRFFKKSIDFKVAMLSYNCLDKKDYDDVISITNNSDTASGYIINHKYYDDLIKCLEYGSEMLAKTNQHWNYINDQVWKKLQLDNKWFIFNTRMGIQRKSFSDLKKCMTDYGF